jgi:transposase
MNVQVARIIPNALFIQPDYPSRLLWIRYVSEENSHAKITRSTQTQLQRRIKHPENQCQHQDQCRQHSKYLKTGQQLNITWPLPEAWDDQTLALKFYPRSDAQPSVKFQEPVWTDVHLELKKKGVTKQLLWEEYTQQVPNRCYSYSQFCARYADWLKKQKRSMRQTHRAGEKLFIDYAGPTIPIVCASTGEIRTAQIFVAALGASHYTFAEATWSQSLPDWLGSHVRAFDFFGGCPALLVPDNLKSGVNKACRYEPELNPSYQQLAAHYAVAVMPARPYKPKDKAKVEAGVLLVERWIMTSVFLCTVRCREQDAAWVRSLYLAHELCIISSISKQLSKS